MSLRPLYLSVYSLGEDKAKSSVDVLNFFVNCVGFTKWYLMSWQTNPFRFSLTFAFPFHRTTFPSSRYETLPTDTIKKEVDPTVSCVQFESYFHKQH